MNEPAGLVAEIVGIENHEAEPSSVHRVVAALQSEHVENLLVCSAVLFVIPKNMKRRNPDEDQGSTISVTSISSR
jgi:hypothetical protein